MDWTSFYVAAAGAAATLVGLLFIAVQFNIDTFTQDPGNRWRAIARSTFAIYTLLFLLPMVFLIPAVDSQGRGYAALLIAGFGTFRSIATWLPVWRSPLPKRVQQLWQTAWLLIGPVVSYLLLAREAFFLLQGDQSNNTLGSVALVEIGLFAIALRNSWNLLVEVTYEKKQQDRTPT